MSGTLRPTDPILRHERAPEEIGRTELRPGLAVALVVLFLATLCGPGLSDLVLRPGARQAWATFGRESVAALDDLPRLAAVNRRALAAIEAVEDELEAASLLREHLLPPVQSLLSRGLGLGNEQAYLGRDGWLFYRADLEHVTGRGFLEPSVLTARQLDRDDGGAAVQPDPLPALLAFERELAARGIRLVVLPVPVKPAVEARHFSRRYEGSEVTPHNPSEGVWRERLAAAGLDVFDPLPLLRESQAAAGAAYLAADTHWRPEAMDAVARDLATHVQRVVGFRQPALAGYGERVARVEGRGDIAVMLRLPPGRELAPPEEVEVRPVIDWHGRPARPERGAEVLLLGDSFSNVFSDVSLGWGAGAGLAERLAFHLQRPVDRLARNAGGAVASRQALAAELAADAGRLDGVRVVVYEFVSRELSQGNWPVVPLGSQPAREPGGRESRR